ncbi:MAG: hypothetical protein ACI9Z4_001821 [Polaribacter sp.]|jgi:hypothetical protein
MFLVNKLEDFFYGKTDSNKSLGLSDSLNTNVFNSYHDFEQWLRVLNAD